MSNSEALALNSARDLGDWVRGELARPKVDTMHITRVLTNEMDRWFKHELTPEDMGDLTKEPVDSGDPRWDAFIEGLVAHHLHVRAAVAPEWTGRTRLEEGWAPNGEVLPSIDWHLIDVFDTPAELLGKGVVFSRHNLVRL